ncbi:hypothetical protein MBLNU13_g06125t4 [Cladosporium sp. NU13]
MYLKARDWLPTETLRSRKAIPVLVAAGCQAPREYTRPPKQRLLLITTTTAASITPLHHSHHHPSSAQSLATAAPSPPARVCPLLSPPPLKDTSTANLGRTIAHHQNTAAFTYHTHATALSPLRQPPQPTIFSLRSRDRPPPPPQHPANTAKVSSTVLQRGGISFAEGVNPSPPNCVQVAEKKLSAGDQERRRRRRSSSLMYHEPPEDLEQLSDQKANPNLNANWVNMKGAWAIHVVIILLLKILYDIVPSISQETSWTMVNISYMFGSYLMFHYVRGVPFEFNGGAYDNLNMWEQIDNGDQYTPAKKFLLSVPICLFLVSTHYTHYDLTYFMINFMATVMVVVPKLPALHRLRFAVFNEEPELR